MEQKVKQIGSSAGVTISKTAMEKLGIKVGDVVNTEATTEAFLVRPKTTAPIDPGVLAWTNKFIEKNRELLKRLADK
jgi:antitoxin component of MazEF toxin-antitoxin module